jgi:hypothetical protein
MDRFFSSALQLLSSWLLYTKVSAPQLLRVAWADARRLQARSNTRKQAQQRSYALRLRSSTQLAMRVNGIRGLILVFTSKTQARKVI